MRHITLLCTVLILLTGSLSAQDRGIQDTIRFEADTLYLGESYPIDLFVTNDYPLAAIAVGFGFRSLDGGMAVIDSALYINRMDDPTVLEARAVHIIHSSGYFFDSLLIAGHKFFGNELPVGNSPILRVYVTGTAVGTIEIDSLHRPPTAEFNFLEFKPFPYETYEPFFIKQYVSIVERTAPPVITFDNSSIILYAGESFELDITASSPTLNDVVVSVEQLSGYDKPMTPQNNPVVSNEHLSWQTTGLDVGIWRLTLKACQGDGQCVDRSVVVQIVDNAELVDLYSVSTTNGMCPVSQVITEDINNDGDAEILTIPKPTHDYKYFSVFDYDFSSQTVDLTFETSSNHVQKGLAVGYIDDDDYLDAVVNNIIPLNAELNIFLNNGNSTFALHDIVSFHSYGTAAIMGDFDNDQYIDYIGSSFDSLIIYRGNSNSSFDFTEIIKLTEKVLSINSADFNTDGKNDLAVGTMSGVHIYLNKGNHVFQLNEFYPQLYGSTDIEVTNKGSDFNNDRYYDLCITTPSVGGDSSEIFIYYGNPSGTFDQQRIRQIEGQVFGNCVADFNNDNNLDIAFVNGSENYISVMYGSESGAFINEVRYFLTSSYPARVEAVDIDLDGDMDLAAFTAQIYSDNNIYVLENLSDPTNSSKSSFSIELSNNVEYEIVSSSGKTLNKVKNSIAASSQYLKNIDDNSMIDSKLNMNVIESGEYQLSVTKKNGVMDGVDFSVSYSIGEHEFMLADKAPMSAAGFKFKIYPDGNSTVSPHPGEFIFETNPTIQWQGSGSFDLQLAYDIDFNNKIIDTTVLSNSFTIDTPLTTNDTTIFYWRYKASGTEFSDYIQSFNFYQKIPTDVSPIDDNLPDKFSLSQNYPNPFNPGTNLEFSLPKASFVTAEIYNIIGQRIRTLVNKEMEAGSYKIYWDGKNDSGDMVVSSIYFFKFTAGDFHSTQKMILLK